MVSKGNYPKMGLFQLSEFTKGNGIFKPHTWFYGWEMGQSTEVLMGKSSNSTDDFLWQTVLFSEGIFMAGRNWDNHSYHNQS